MNEIDQKFAYYIDSDEFRENLKNHFLKVDQKRKIIDIQLLRFHLFYSHRLDELIEKISTYYNSEKYYNLWVMRGFEPPETLYWFLFKYAEKYGRKCNRTEIRMYCNCFTSEIYYTNGFYFQRLNGQGSVIHINKKGETNGR